MQHNQGDKRIQAPTGKPAVSGPRALVSWLTLALLALNILASGMLPVRLDGGAMPMGGPMVGGTPWPAIDCAPDGDGNHGAGAPVQPHTHDTFCIFCLPLMHGAVDVPQALTVPPPRHAGAVLFAALRVAAPRRYAILAAWPRGPPGTRT